MPRRKATKACQTDYVFLSEQQVENIVNQRVGYFEDELKRLEVGLRATDNIKQLESEKREILGPRISQLEGFIEWLQEEIGHLKTRSEKLTNDLDSLNNLQQSTEVLVEQLDGRLDAIEEETGEEMADLNNRFATKDNHQDMQVKVDDIEQQGKIKNLRFFGIEEQEDEDPTKRVIDFVQSHMNIEIKPTAIEASRMGALHRLSTKPRDILVKFDSGILRNAIYKKKIMLRHLNQQVFINEDLTVKRSHLFFQARKMRKQKMLFGVWTQVGNVLVKVNPNSNPIAVSNIEELKGLINDSHSYGSNTDFEMTSLDDSL